MLVGTRRERNVQHGQVELLRQAFFSRLAGYEDTNAAERPCDHGLCALRYYTIHITADRPRRQQFR